QTASPRGPGEPSTQEAPSADAGFATADLSERETEMAMDRLASGAQSIPSDIPTHCEGPCSEEKGFAVEEEEADGKLYAWGQPGGTACPPMEQAADLFNEDWDLELKSISQEIKSWVCCAPQGNMMYDPSWHHPPPLISHYSKMILFETGQFDDAED
uniref:Coordinator of PRMT5 and differentiation stimulator n=1 Tax=Nannospalax galili TaxID=1026970 RepID=A0A8C6RLR9_NANGA